MASADSFTLSARVHNKTADEFKALAESLGLTPNALIKSMVENAVSGKPQTTPSSATPALAPAPGEAFPRAYKVALDLIDELIEAGYPEGEIENTFTNIRREML